MPKNKPRRWRAYTVKTVKHCRKKLEGRNKTISCLLIGRCNIIMSIPTKLSIDSLYATSTFYKNRKKPKTHMES